MFKTYKHKQKIKSSTTLECNTDHKALLCCKKCRIRSFTNPYVLVHDLPKAVYLSQKILYNMTMLKIKYEQTRTELRKN